MPADTHEQRIGNMPHQTEDAQTRSADEPGLGSAKPTLPERRQDGPRSTRACWRTAALSCPPFPSMPCPNRGASG